MELIQQFKDNPKVYGELLRDYLDSADKDRKDTLEVFKERSWELTPAQCLWRAIALDPDPYKKVD